MRGGNLPAGFGPAGGGPGLSRQLFHLHRLSEAPLDRGRAVRAGRQPVHLQARLPQQSVEITSSIYFLVSFFLSILNIKLSYCHCQQINKHSNVNLKRISIVPVKIGIDSVLFSV